MPAPRAPRLLVLINEHARVPCQLSLRSIAASRVCVNPHHFDSRRHRNRCWSTVAKACGGSNAPCGAAHGGKKAGSHPPTLLGKRGDKAGALCVIHSRATTAGTAAS